MPRMLPFALWTWFTTSLLLSGCSGELYKPATPVKCFENTQCPPEWPCCSPYGECGAGPVCLGGCNPRYSFDKLSCAPMPALVPPASVHFTSQPHKWPGSSRVSPEKELQNSGITPFTDYLVTKDRREAEKMLQNYNFVYSGPVSVHGPSGNLILSMPRRSTGSLVAESQSFLYGRASVRMRTGRSRGVITAMVLISAVGDEIDYEILGSQRNEVQTNYYAKGELDYTKMKRISLSSDAWADYHDYEIDWNEERIQWIVDGKVSRTIHKADTWDKMLQKYKYPHTPMRLEVALWPGGSERNLPGTIEWAGGPIDWDNAPDMVEKGTFTAQVEQMHVVPLQNQFVAAMTNCVKQGKKITYAYGSAPGTDFNQDILEWYCDMVPNVPGWTASGANIPRKDPLSSAIWKKEMLPVRLEKNFIPDIRRLSFTPNGTIVFNTTKNDTWSRENPSSSSSSGAWRHYNPFWRLLRQVNQFRGML